MQRKTTFFNKQKHKKGKQPNSVFFTKISNGLRHQKKREKKLNERLTKLI